jgi:hypothetical protein
MRDIATHRNLRTGPARAAEEHLLAANDDAGDLTAEDLHAIDEEFGIDQRDLERVVQRRAEARGSV